MARIAALLDSLGAGLAPAGFSLLLAAAAASLGAQATSPPAPLQAEITSGEWVGDATPLVIRLSRVPAAHERLIVAAGARDLTPQLERDGNEWRFDNDHVPLPAGRHALVVTLIRDDSVASVLVQQEVRVEGAFGVRERRATRSAEVGLKSRLRSETTPLPAPTDRRTYNDLDGQLGLGITLEGRDFALQVRSAAVGTSHRPNALRFGARGADAPLVDLSSYLAQFRKGSAEVSVGHLTAGNQRHLLNGFSARGAGLRIARQRVDAAVAVLHGSQLVGWNDLLGVAEPDHRILSGTIGMEALRTPGAMRVELSAMSGSILPRTGFNQGAVTDAERSAGAALRVQSALFGSRLRLEAGYASSTFDNPPDPLLGPVDSLVPVARETRDARFVESSLDVVRGRRLFGSRTASLTLGASHERVAPLYRSVGTYVQSDRVQDRIAMQGTVSGLAIAVHHAAGSNNVDRIPSILTTRSRQTGADIGGPLGALLGRQNAWLPSVTMRLARHHHVATHIPAGNGFDPSHAPDQVSRERTVAITWQSARGSVALRNGRSEQDNRQPGRERADLVNRTRGAQGSFSPHRHVALSADAQWVTALTVERDVTERIRSLGVNASLFASLPVSLTLQAARTASRTAVEQRSRDDLQWSAQLAVQLPQRGGAVTRAFLRYQSQRNSFTDPAASHRTRMALMDGGLSVSFP